MPSPPARACERPAIDNRQHSALPVPYGSRNTPVTDRMAQPDRGERSHGARGGRWSQRECPPAAGGEGRARAFSVNGCYLFVGPENLATLSGAMKEMLDRCYYPLLGRIEGRPYATIIAAGSDGAGAQRQLDRIATGWRLKRVAEPMIVNFSAQTPEEILAFKQVPPATIRSCREMGAALVEGIRAGIF